MNGVQATKKQDLEVLEHREGGGECKILGKRSSDMVHGTRYMIRTMTLMNPWGRRSHTKHEKRNTKHETRIHVISCPRCCTHLCLLDVQVHWFGIARCNIQHSTFTKVIDSAVFETGCFATSQVMGTVSWMASSSCKALNLSLPPRQRRGRGKRRRRRRSSTRRRRRRRSRYISKAYDEGNLPNWAIGLPVAAFAIENVKEAYDRLPNARREACLESKVMILIKVFLLIIIITRIR